MSMLRRDPSLQELFDRIIQLENEVARLKQDVIAPLKAENKALSHKYEDLWKAFKLEVENTTEHLDTLGVALWPVVYKVFPGAAKADRAFFKILDSRKKNKKQE
jgi:hypothetical protein